MRKDRLGLVSVIVNTLKEHGFRVSECTRLHEDVCFDVAAKRNNLTLLIKALINIDNYSKSQAEDLRKMTKTLSAVPLIVGLKTKRGAIVEGVVHERFGIRVVGVTTFVRALSNEHPIAYVKRGGVYVKIDGEALRRARSNKGLSLGELAKMVGVTRKTIYEYERCTMDATVEVAARLEEALGVSIVKPLNIFDVEWSIKEERAQYEVENTNETLNKARRLLLRLGFRVATLRRAPFNMVASSSSVKVVAEVTRGVEEVRRREVRLVKEIADVIESKALIMVEEKSDVDRVEGVPVVSIESVREVKSVLRKS